MIAIAHFIAVTFYVGAAAVAAVPFARRVKAPVSGVVIALLLGIGAHATALAGLTRQAGAASLTGLGPGLSFAGLVLALSLVIVESLAREVSLTLVAAPLAGQIGGGPWIIARHSKNLATAGGITSLRYGLWQITAALRWSGGGWFAEHGTVTRAQVALVRLGDPEAESELANSSKITPLIECRAV